MSIFTTITITRSLQTINYPITEASELYYYNISHSILSPSSATDCKTTICCRQCSLINSVLTKSLIHEFIQRL